MFCCFLGCIRDFSFSSFVTSSGSASGRDDDDAAAAAVPVPVGSSVGFLFASPVFSCAVVSAMGHANPERGV